MKRACHRGRLTRTRTRLPLPLLRLQNSSAGAAASQSQHRAALQLDALPARHWVCPLECTGHLDLHRVWCPTQDHGRAGHRGHQPASWLSPVKVFWSYQARDRGNLRSDDDDAASCTHFALIQALMLSYPWRLLLCSPCRLVLELL